MRVRAYDIIGTPAEALMMKLSLSGQNVQMKQQCLTVCPCHFLQSQAKLASNDKSAPSSERRPLLEADRSMRTCFVLTIIYIDAYTRLSVQDT